MLSSVNTQKINITEIITTEGLDESILNLLDLANLLKTQRINSKFKLASQCVLSKNGLFKYIHKQFALHYLDCIALENIRINIKDRLGIFFALHKNISQLSNKDIEKFLTLHSLQLTVLHKASITDKTTIFNFLMRNSVLSNIHVIQSTIWHAEDLLKLPQLYSLNNLIKFANCLLADLNKHSSDHHKMNETIFQHVKDIIITLQRTTSKNDLPGQQQLQLLQSEYHESMEIFYPPSLSLF